MHNVTRGIFVSKELLIRDCLMQNVFKNTIHSLIYVSINCWIQIGSFNKREEKAINNG